MVEELRIIKSGHGYIAVFRPADVPPLDKTLAELLIVNDLVDFQSDDSATKEVIGDKGLTVTREVEKDPVFSWEGRDYGLSTHMRIAEALVEDVKRGIDTYRRFCKYEAVRAALRGSGSERG